MNLAICNLHLVSIRSCGCTIKFDPPKTEQPEQPACLHDETERLGAIWTRCTQCGKKWADDEPIAQPVQPSSDLEALRADAARYRFLKVEAYEAVIPHGNTLNGRRTAWITKLHPGATFEAAIDAAISTKEAA